MPPLVSRSAVLLAALALPVHAGLVFENPGTLVYAFDSVAGEAGDLNADFGTLTQEATAGQSRARVDLVAGVGQIFAADPTGDAGVGGGGATTGFRFSLRNTGVAPVVFAADSIAVDVDANLAHSVGSGISGIQTQVLGSFTLGGKVSQGGSARFQQNYGDSPLVPGVELFRSATPTLGSGVVDVRMATPARVDFSLGFDTFTLAPDGRADFQFLFTGDVRADDGSLGVIDAESSAVLRFTLPDGIDLISGVPLGWVSTVPEPAQAGYWLAWLSLIMWAGVRRRCR